MELEDLGSVVAFYPFASIITFSSLPDGIYSGSIFIIDYAILPDDVLLF